MALDDETKLPAIRPALIADVPTITLIARQSFERYVPLIVRPPAPMRANFSKHVLENTVFIAKSEKSQGVVLGYSIILQKDEAWLLDNIAVNPWAQGRGIVSALIATCEAFLRDCGAKRYLIYTNEVMEQTLTSYPAIGFVETNRRLEDRFSRVYFSKALV